MESGLLVVSICMEFLLVHQNLFPPTRLRQRVRRFADTGRHCCESDHTPKNCSVLPASQCRSASDREAGHRPRQCELLHGRHPRSVSWTPVNRITETAIGAA